MREHLDVVEDFVLTTTELAKRLGVGRATLYDHRKKGDLPEWTFGKDRDGISWGFDESRQKFTPFINKCDK